MNRGPNARATIELCPGAGAPEGVLIDRHGRARRFSGWIEFAVAVEDWRMASSLAGPDPVLQREVPGERRPARQGENS
jgi:hypothetical protein